MMKHLAPLLIFLALAVLLGLGLGQRSRDLPSPLIGRAAPEFVLPQLEDPLNSISHEQFRGQVTLVNIWASWCVSCRHEHELLLELARRDLVEIVGIDYKDERADGLAWLQRLGNPYDRVGFDESGEVGLEWGLYGVPESYLIDAEGIVRHKVVGPISEQILADTLLPMIEQLQRERG